MLHCFDASILRHFVIAMLHCFDASMLRRFIASLLRRFRNQFSKNDSEPGTNKKSEILEKIPFTPSFALVRPNWPVPRAEIVLTFAAGRLPIRYRGFRMESRCPRQLAFRPVGTDFICVEQIARYVIVIQRAFCITLTKKPKNRAGQSPKSINLKYFNIWKNRNGS